MKNNLLKRIVAFVLLFTVCITVVSSSFTVSADSISTAKKTISELQKKADNLQKQINSLKKQKNSQQKVKDALDNQIINTQAQISACNNLVTKYKNEINNCQNNIDKKNEEIADAKELFKKRIRSIYNSNTGSNIQILLGANTFSEFLALTEVTQCISAQDRKLINKITDAITAINAEISKRQQLQNEQSDIKKTLASKKSQLNSQVNEVNSVISSIKSKSNSLSKNKSSIEKDIAEQERYLATLLSGGESNAPFDGIFQWPCPGYTYISAGWKSNDSVHKGHHFGIDIAGGSIAGKPIVAAATGKVSKIYTACTHNYKKSSSCGCGGGYGNHVRISHGVYKGKQYLTIYAHMQKVAAKNGQQVNRGKVIGYVGTTGFSTGYHLHFGIAVDGNWVNPSKYSYINKK